MLNKRAKCGGANMQGEDEAKERKVNDLQSSTTKFETKENDVLASSRTEAWERVDRTMQEAATDGVGDLFRSMGFTAAAEFRGGKFGASTSMVRMMEVQLELRLEDVTGPIDPQQVQKSPAPRTALSAPGAGPRSGTARYFSVDTAVEVSPARTVKQFATCAKEEFECVVGEQGVNTKTWTLVEDAVPKVASKTGVRVRDARTMSEVLKSAEVKLGGLVPEEVVVLRLLTGPMYEVYNLTLRGGGVGAEDGKGLRFATTCLLISSGLAKLARVGAALKGDSVYRGLRGGGEQFSAGLLEKDGKGFASVVDLSFLSVTENRAEAERHAARSDACGGEQGAMPTILEITVGKTSMGSRLKWVSLFPEEEEIVYPPRTHLEVVGAPRVEEGVRVITLRPTVDQSVRTLEQMLAARKEAVLKLVHSLGWDMRHDAQREGELGALRGAIDAWEKGLLANMMLTQDSGWYTDNGKYRHVVVLVFKEWESGREKVRLPGEMVVEQQTHADGEEEQGEEGADSAALSCSFRGNESAAVTSASKGGAKGIREVSGNDVAALHSKFFQDATFGGRRGTFGGVEAFDLGIEHQVGKMDVNVSKAMFAEHTMSEDSTEEFFAPNTQLSTTPLEEWRFVVGIDGGVNAAGEIVEGGKPGNEALVEGRNAHSLKHLVGLTEAVEAELTLAELVALRLCTGPMGLLNVAVRLAGQYVRYNGVLRGFYSRNLYTTTLHLIVSGLRKLCRISAPPPKNAEGEREVFRGTGGMALPPDFFRSDEQGFAGGVEAAFMSTTTDRKVAMHYSGVGGGAESEGGLRTVFRYLVGERSLGADVSWLSQFEGEKEMLFGPMTHMQIVGKPWVEEGGVSVITVRPTVSQRSRTLEQVERGRCEGLLLLGASLLSDVRFCARNHAVWELCKDLLDGQGAAVAQEVIGRAATAYNDNVTYGHTLLRLIDLSEEGRKAVAERIREAGVERWSHGDREGALEHLNKAIAVMEELCANDRARMDRLGVMLGEVAGIHGESGVGAAEATTALAVNLMGQGEYEKALELLKEALGIYQAELSEEEQQQHTGIALTHGHIGRLYFDQGKDAMALEQYEKCLAIQIKVLGEGHRCVGVTHNNMGSVYGNQGKDSMALELYGKCLAIQVKVLGDEHPSVAITYSNIGGIYAKQGKYELELELYEKCLAIRIKALGEDHPDVATTYSNIAVVFGRQGKHAMALELYEKCLAIQIRALGENHPDVADTKYNMADSLENQGELEWAGGLFRECAAIYSKVHGAEHEETLDALKRARGYGEGDWWGEEPDRFGAPSQDDLRNLA